MTRADNPGVRHKEGVLSIQLTRQLTNPLHAIPTRNNTGVRKFGEQIQMGGILHGSKTLTLGGLFKRFFWHGGGYRI